MYIQFQLKYIFKKGHIEQQIQSDQVAITNKVFFFFFKKRRSSSVSETFFLSAAWQEHLMDLRQIR